MFTHGPSQDDLTGSGDRGLHANPTFRTYFDRLPINEVEAVQLGRGAFDHRSLEVWGRDSIVVWDRLTPLASFAMVPEPDWIMILWPHGWAGDFRVNGLLASADDVFCRFDGGEWCTAGAGRDTLSIGVRRTVLATACAALEGIDPDETALKGDVIVNRSEFCAALRYILARLLVAAQDVGTIEGRLVMPPAFEADLISALATYFTASDDTEANAIRSEVSAMRIVRTVQEFVRDTDPAYLATSHLCRSAGVGRTRLHQCLMDVYGVSPGRYLKRLRLTRAREMLLRSSDPSRSVKEAALTLGFLSSGRFAFDYREMFGEFPSETRARGVTGRVFRD